MTFDDYLEHAEECERLAELTEFAAIKSSLTASAAMWRKLAEDFAASDGALQPRTDGSSAI
jgi:hypothetical protein